MAKISRISASLLIVLMTLLACKDNTPAAAANVIVTLDVVADNSLQKFRGFLVDDFNQKVIQLPGGGSVQLNMQFLPDMLASQKISNGQLKIDGWLTSEFLVPHVNKNIKNLGAPQVDCQMVASTPVVIATTPEYLELAQPKSNKISRDEVFRAHLRDAARSQVAFLDPLRNSSGLRAFMALFTQEIDKPFAPLQSRLTQIFAYNSDRNNILDFIQSQSTERALFYVGTEQQILSYNAEQGKNLKTLLLRQDQTVDSLSLCRSEVAWVTPQKAAALAQYLNYLRSFQVQEGFKHASFRSYNEANLDLAKAAKVEAPEVLAARADTVDYYLQGWNQNRPKVGLTLLLDTSGSLEEGQLDSLKSAVTNFLSRFNAQDAFAFSSFNDELIRADHVLQDRELVAAELGKLTASGGSKLYDAVLYGSQSAANLFSNEYKKVLLLVTDSSDIGSLSTFELVRQTLKSQMRTNNVLLIAVVLKKDGIDHGKLKELVEVSQGYYVESTQSDLNATLEKVWSLM